MRCLGFYFWPSGPDPDQDLSIRTMRVIFGCGLLFFLLLISHDVAKDWGYRVLENQAVIPATMIDDLLSLGPVMTSELSF